DENGIVFTSRLAPGANAAIEATASASGKLDAWIDLNRDGDWEDPGEKIFNGLDLTAGATSLAFPIPSDAVPGTTYARFRFSSAGAELPTGRAADGEVEDYAPLIDALALFSINDASSAEGNEGAAALTFTVSRDHNLHDASVDIAAEDGSAVAGSDYSPLSPRTLIFPAGGALTQTITIQIRSDVLGETDETFYINLSNPSGAAISDGQALGVIANDDPLLVRAPVMNDFGMALLSILLAVAGAVLLRRRGGGMVIR
ncbi:MAG: hypothetical protein GY859_09825, partial [Desulfobacterales bacterium]|nr:hypothetical protein [Desulfobacterales bacterium]